MKTTKYAIVRDKIDEINFESQDAMYQMTLANSLDEINDIRDRFISFLESFVESIVSFAKDMKDDIVRAMKKALDIFTNLYKARVAIYA